MSMQMHHEQDNIFRLEIQGMLRLSELKSAEAEVLREILRVGPVRLLFVLDHFDGWEPEDNWRDLGFYLKHGNDGIERIAIVGNERWRSLALMFAAADLRKAPVEYFRDEAVGAARAWLKE